MPNRSTGNLTRDLANVNLAHTPRPQIRSANSILSYVHVKINQNESRLRFGYGKLWHGWHGGTHEHMTNTRTVATGI